MTPSENYKDLRKQFLALKRLFQSKEIEIDFYKNIMKTFNFNRIIELEAELESQKEMNTILTEELENNK